MSRGHFILCPSVPLKTKEIYVGLDVSHDAFSGAYSSFNRFRQAIAKAMGGSFPPHEKETDDDGKPLNREMWYWGDGFSRETHPGLFCLLAHSDCDGEISREDCGRIVEELEPLLPALDAMGLGSGHIERGGGFGAVARRFIEGCVTAFEANESLIFS